MKIPFIKRLARAMPLAMLLVLCRPVFAQELKAGDRLPGLLLQDMNQSQPFSLKSLNKKLVILQFWNTLCKSCIRSFPKVDSLQKKYDRHVEFIFVSEEPAAEIRAFFGLHRKIPRPAVRFVAGDTILSRYFPHQFVPHHVWLKDGETVVAITTGTNTSDRNLVRYLESEVPDLPGIRKQVHYNWEKPAVSTKFDSAWAGYAYFSYLMPPVDSAYPTFRADRLHGSKRHNRVIANKATMLRLFLEAFNEAGKYQFERRANNLVVDIKKHRERLEPEDWSLYDDWSRNNTYLYDLMVPPAQAGELYKIMQRDLQRIFSLKAGVEKQKAACMCIVRLDNTDAMASRGGAPRNGNIDHKYDSLLHFRNVDMESVVRRLQAFSRFTPFHLKDESGYPGKVDLDVSRSLLDVFDYTVLEADLKRYGLGLVRKTCTAEVLVIREE